MSYQRDMEQGKKPGIIEMPPLPEEVVEQLVPEQSEEEVIEMQPLVAEIEEEQEEPVVQETQQAKNFRFLREKAEKQERELKDMQRVILQQQQQLQQQQPQIQTKPQQNYNLEDDDFVQGSHLNNVDKKIKDLENKVKTYELKSKYSDFDRVLSNENVDSFERLHPELANSLNMIPDIYNKAEAAYNMIKKLNIGDNMASSDKQKALVNSVKPKPVASINPQRSNSPLTQANPFANGLTKELQEALRKEMAEARKAL